jgi:hypothetical protein
MLKGEEGYCPPLLIELLVSCRIGAEQRYAPALPSCWMGPLGMGKEVRSDMPTRTVLLLDGGE